METPTFVAQIHDSGFEPPFNQLGKKKNPDRVAIEEALSEASDGLWVSVTCGSRARASNIGSMLRKNGFEARSAGPVVYARTPPGDGSTV